MVRISYLIYKVLRVLGGRISKIPSYYIYCIIINTVTKITKRRVTFGFIDNDAEMKLEVGDGVEVATVVKFASDEVVFDGAKVVLDGVKVGNTTPPLEFRAS